MSILTLVYDDTVEIPDRIKTIIGKSSFGDIKLKRKTNFNQLREIIGKSKIDVKIIKKEDNKKQFNLEQEDSQKLYIFSNYIIKDQKEFLNFLENIVNEKENCSIVQEDRVIAVFLKNGQYNDENIQHYKKIQVNFFLDISKYDNLLTYISGKLDTRFFNSLKVEENMITKKSTNKTKIKKEYMYYKLLPDEMKKWMVEPFDYKENDTTAQYTMKRILTTDLAVRWTHNAITKSEMEKILDRAFYFINNRAKKNISKDEYQRIEDRLYVEKVKNRIEELKKHPVYSKFEMLIKGGTRFNSIDEIMDYYLQIYKNNRDDSKEYTSVIGHGDLCFANMLYDSEKDELKLIDPRGALTEEEMWTNPYYDVVKLSHSICGNYDFFNYNRYNIYLNNNFQYELEIKNNNQKYINIFKRYVEENNFNYNLLRIYEASLFLSMLPLHMDYPQKVFGFLLNSINILDEMQNTIK